MDDWEEIKARLEIEAKCTRPCDECGVKPTDIRAALERVEELEREAGILTQGITDQHDRAQRAEAEVARMAAQRDIALVHGPEDMIRALEELTRERDEARAEAKRYHDALVARHGGEPVALLDELDASRAEVARLEGLIVRVDDMLYERKQPIIILSQEARRIRAAKGEW